MTAFRYLPLFLVSMLAACFTAQAQQSLNDADRIKVLGEIRAYKHEVLSKELNLSKEQERVFFPVYDEMDDKLIQISLEIRDLVREVNDNEDATDEQVNAAAAALFSQKQREGVIEMEYFDKFKEILEPRQVLGIKSAEKKFTQKLVRHHRRFKGQDGK